MGDSYENTQMPEKPEETVNLDAIPVDDKGRPLPDPTENFRDYIAPSGLEALKQAYEAVEEDEGVKETMEPPQQTTFFKKHRSGKRGYDYYGTPAGSVPNDTNGVKPSALSQLFSAAEAVEIEANEPDEDEQFKAFDPAINIQKSAVIETPDQKEMQSKSVLENDPRDAFIRAGYTTADDEVFKKNEVKRDTSTPRILDYYKDSTNTKVIFESEPSENGSAISPNEKTASDLFNSNIPLTKAQIRAAKRAEKKANRERAKLLKKQAKAKRKAEKAQRKAELKAKKSRATFGSMPTFDIKENEPTQAPTKNSTANEEAKANNNAELAQLQAKEFAEKEKAERIARETAQEAANKLRQEQEALLRHKEEIKLAQQKHSETAQKLEEEKAAAQKAREEAELARKEAERIKAELELMKDAAAKALEQKQKAEEAAKKAKEEKEQLEAEVKKEKTSSSTEATSAKHTKSTREEKFRQERDEAIAKAKAEKDAAVAKAKAEREASVAKAKADKDAAIAKAKANHSQKSKAKDESSLSSKKNGENSKPIYSSKSSTPKKATDIEELKKDLSILMDKNNTVSRSAKKETTEDDKPKK